MNNFIYTKDIETANYLKKCTTLLSEKDGIYVFINMPTKINFSEINKNKYILKNTLNI